MAVAHHQPPAPLVTLVGQLAQLGVHLRFQGGGQHPPRALPNDVIQQRDAFTPRPVLGDYSQHRAYLSDRHANVDHARDLHDHPERYALPSRPTGFEHSSHALDLLDDAVEAFGSGVGDVLGEGDEDDRPQVSMVVASRVGSGHRRRRREDYISWERPEPMELWQMDIVGSVMMADGTEAKVITGVDDHSRFAVIATVVRRATGRAVCAAFVTAMQRYGVPAEVLTDNGKQFTGRFTSPRPGEVLFERICRDNGITAILTRPRTPTTTGKVERFHQTLQRECLDGRVFATIEDAQAAVDAFVAEYNFDRPHQGIDDAYPADRFRPALSDVDLALRAVRVPAGLLPFTPIPVPAPRAPVDPDAMVVSAGLAEAVEVDRVVPPSGNLMVGRQQIWLGPARAGLPIVVWVDTDRLHVLGVHGGRIKSTASRLSQRDLARLRSEGGRPARPSPLPTVQRDRPQAVEVDRLVSVNGCINIAGKQVAVGSPLAGQRVRVRLDGILLQVVDDTGHLRRTMRSPVTPAACTRLRGARPAGPPAGPNPDGPLVDRVVGVQGTIQVAGQKVRVGRVHARKVVHVHIEETALTVYDGHAAIVVVPRQSNTDLNRFRAKHQIMTGGGSVPV